MHPARLAKKGTRRTPPRTWWTLYRDTAPVLIPDKPRATLATPTLERFTLGIEHADDFDLYFTRGEEIRRLRPDPRGTVAVFEHCTRRRRWRRLSNVGTLAGAITELVRSRWRSM